MTVVDTSSRRSFFARHRTLTVVASALLAVFLYRFLAIYRYWPDRCEVRKGTPLVITNADPPKAPPRRETLTVLSYNIQGHASLVRSEHLEKVAEVIRASQADIVGLNEVHRWTWQNRFDDQLGDLARMTSMNVVYAPSFRFFGGQFGNAVLTRGTVDSATVYDLPTIGEPRTLLGADIRIDGTTIRFFVTHVAAWGKLSKAMRREQLRCVSRHVRGVRSLLTGDLNAPHEADEIRELAVSSGFLNASPKAATHRVMEQAIDYVMVTPDLGVRTSRVIEDGPSDHRAVLIEIDRASLKQE